MDPCSPSHEKNTHPIFVARRCRGREVALRPSEKCKKVRLFARRSAHAAIRPRSGDFFLKRLAFALFSTKLITCFTHRTAVRSSVSRHTQTATHMTPHDLTVSRQAHGSCCMGTLSVLPVPFLSSNPLTPMPPPPPPPPPTLLPPPPRSSPSGRLLLPRMCRSFVHAAQPRFSKFCHVAARAGRDLSLQFDSSCEGDGFLAHKPDGAESFAGVRATRE